MNQRVLAIVLGLLSVTISAIADDAARWEKTIARFEKEDAVNPPEPDGILFIGSSSIRFWDTDAAFPEYNIVNRGFGGSQMSDVLAYMERIVFPYRPKLVVLYEGDNDIAAGESPESIITETMTFIDQVHARLPETTIAYISIKPSLLRWEMMDKMRTVNGAIRERAKQSANLKYIDVDTPMIGEDGLPRQELFAKDGLHMNDAGYAIWNGLVRPHLVAATE